MEGDSRQVGRDGGASLLPFHLLTGEGDSSPEIQIPSFLSLTHNDGTEKAQHQEYGTDFLRRWAPIVPCFPSPSLPLWHDIKILDKKLFIEILDIEIGPAHFSVHGKRPRRSGVGGLGAGSA